MKKQREPLLSVGRFRTLIQDIAPMSQPTVWRAIRAGKIKASFTPGGHARISFAEVRRFIRNYGANK